MLGPTRQEGAMPERVGTAPSPGGRNAGQSEAG